MTTIDDIIIDMTQDLKQAPTTGVARGGVRSYGQLRRNVRKRPDSRDPDLTGWLQLGTGKISMAGWVDKRGEDVGGQPFIKITARQWGSRRRIYHHGEIDLNKEARKGSTDPQWIGTLDWSLQQYSIAMWPNTDADGTKFYKLTAEIADK